MRNLICWLVGCDPKKDWEGGTRYSPAREAVVPCLAHYCGRCGLKDGDARNVTSIGKTVDRRNLYSRTIPFWLTKWRNRRYSQEVAGEEWYRQTSTGRREYAEHLARQSEKLAKGLL